MAQAGSLDLRGIRSRLASRGVCVADGGPEELKELLNRTSALEISLAQLEVGGGNSKEERSAERHPGRENRLTRSAECAGKFERTPPATVASRRSVPRSPLELARVQAKEAEEAWTRERGQLRREAAAEHKRAVRLEQELKKEQALRGHERTEKAALRQALKERDDSIAALEAARSALQRHLDSGLEQAAQQLACLSDERTELQRALHAALDRFQTPGSHDASRDESPGDGSTDLQQQARRHPAVDELRRELAQCRVALRVEQKKGQAQAGTIDRLLEVQQMIGHARQASAQQTLHADAGRQP